MKAVVITLGVLIALAFVALIWGFISRLNGHGGPPQAPDYQLPHGSKIVLVQSTTGDRVYMAVQTPQGGEVDIFNAEDGKLVVRILAQK
jgi:hypothetical protein